MKLGLNKLEKEKQNIIRQRVFDIYKERKIFIKNGNEKDDFSYECPFLFDNLCSIYEHRAIICRVHGLISLSLKGENQFTMPSCVNKGLNYANVWDEKIRGFSVEKSQTLNIKSTPQAYPIRYEAILKNLNYIGLGDIRMMFEWIIMDIPDYQKHLDEISKNCE